MAVFPSRKIVLPNKINFVNWIRSSKTQYINLGIKANSNTRVVCEVEGYSLAENGTTSLYGARTSTSASDQFSFNIAGSANYRADYRSSRATFATNLSFTGRITVDQNKNVCTITPASGTAVSVTNTQGSFNGQYEMILFGENRGGNKQYFCAVKLFSFKAYEGTTLIMDLRPCLDQNGVACLYDIVSNQYLRNAGTGTFAYG